MSTLDRTGQRPTAVRRVAVGASDGHVDEAGVYLTDEVFLYRVVGLTTSGPDELVELEDCYGLDVVQVPISEVRARRLRVVTAAAG